MIIVTVLIVALLSLGQLSLQLPPEPKKALDSQFPHWKLIEYSQTLYGDQVEAIDSHAKPFFICKLNHDTIPDYALGIVINKGRTLTIHFVALVSNGDSFSVFTLASYINPKPMTRYLFLYPKNQDVTNFGWGDKANVPESLLHTWDKNEMVCKFDTDCPALLRTDKNGCRTFVFEMGKFWSFEACD